jgi:hypothetical protein
MEVGLKVITEKTRYMLLTLHQNVGQCFYINKAN